MRTTRRFGLTLVIAIAVVTLALAFGPLRATLWNVVASTRGAHTVDSRLAQFGDAVHARLRPAFEAAGVPLPPARLAFVAFKDTKTLEVYARAADRSPWRHVTTYPILAASGGPGPKLREGDRQVPEGIYRVESLNPNSRFHVSLRLDYPNAFDRRMAKADGRTDLGGDIMIHGSAVSIGCLAIGDAAAEDLFALTARVGAPNVTVLVSPTDFRAAHVSSAGERERHTDLGRRTPRLPARRTPRLPLAQLTRRHRAPRWDSVCRGLPCRSRNRRQTANAEERTRITAATREESRHSRLTVAFTRRDPEADMAPMRPDRAVDLLHPHRAR